MSSYVQTGGRHAGWPRFSVKNCDGTWTAIKLDTTGALVAMVRNQPIKKAAYYRLQAALGDPRDEPEYETEADE